MSHLRSWQSGEEVTYRPPRELEEAWREQCALGWNQFFEGWLSRLWVVEQQHFYTATRSQRMGKRWVSALIQKLWDTAWDLWEHRNGVLHKKENLVTASMGIHLNQRVTRVFIALCSRPLWSNNGHLVRLPLSQLLETNVNYKAQWLAVAEPALREESRQTWQAQNRASRSVTGMQRCMFAWLHCQSSD